MNWSERELMQLREQVAAQMSCARFAHTRGVEEMAAQLAALYCPGQEGLLRAAALLHDITKEYDNKAQLALLDACGIPLREDERKAPKIWHAITAPPVILREYPAFAHPVLLSAVRWHTTGHVGMTVEEAILYLADVIEEGRQYPACVALRQRFFAPQPEKMPPEVRRLHLYRVVLESLRSMMVSLAEKGQGACLDTEQAAADLETRIY